MSTSNLAAESRPEPSPASRAISIQWGGVVLDGFLLALVAIGILFRFSWTNWSQDTDIHPDEYGLTATLTRLAVPDSLGDYFNTRLSPLSPYQKYDANGLPTASGPDNRMRWGQWPITLIRWAAEATDNTGYRELRLMGRRLSALVDSLSLLVVFLIGRRLYGTRVGLLAAALSALAVMPIQQSHFMTSDNFGVLFSALAMYCAVRVAQGTLLPLSLRERGPGGEGLLWYALFGVAFGMALASRINLLPLLGEVLVAGVIAGAGRWGKAKGELWDIALDIGLRVAFAAVVGFLTFRVTQPMAFRAETGDTTVLTLRPNPEWLESMSVAQAESSGIGGGPPGEQWTNRPALVFPFINMVLWGMGLPLGLTAWAGFAWAGWRSYKIPAAWRTHLLPLTWAGGYFLFMGTRWVKSVRYFLPIYPFLILFAAWVIIELWKARSGPEGGSQPALAGGPGKSEVRRRNLTSDLRPLTSSLALAIGAVVTLGTLAWAWGFTGIYRTDNSRIQASRWMYQNIPAPFNLHIQTDEGGAYTEPLAVPSGLPILAEVPYRVQFQSHVSGTVSGFTVAHAQASLEDSTPGMLRVVLSADPDGRTVLAQADIPITPSGDDPRGVRFSAELGPAAVEKGQTYYLTASVPQGGALQVSGATVSNEDWDEGLPLRIDGRDAFGGLYRGLTMNVRWADDVNKRQMFIDNLAQVDYIILPSQRAIWSASRLPNTYPMTLEYYRALFDGRLGFELAATFTSPIRLGPLQISDVGGSAAWGRAPELPMFNDSLFAAEEAFSVYDHAPVWVFKKRADFSLDRARAILESVDLNTVVRQGPHDATIAPTLLNLPADRLAEQRAGGTWGEMFNRDSLINRSHPVGVVAWWLVVVLLGWAAFPLTAAALRGLPDRGYPLAKVVSLLVIAWLAWMAGSFRLLPFTRSTLLLMLGLLVAVSAGLGIANRRELREFLRAHWKYVLVVEGLALALFLFDLAIRFGNSDLWHPNYGGEKPMDFSYLNAVLKSTSFPPYDPWFAGGYINYYYFGFVIVGVLIKLIGMVPSMAYNLVLPTLFSCLGLGAFSVAYNLVAHRTGPRALGAEMGGGEGGPVVESPPIAAEPPAVETASADPEPNGWLWTGLLEKARGWLELRPGPNPYLAGLMAALMIVVLGNLGEVKVLLDGFERTAEYPGFESSIPGLTSTTRILNGAFLVFTGQRALPIGNGAWYWDPTRIIPPGEGEAGPITEFPFFTFLYADLHAHMIALPLTLLALAWAVSVVLGARGEGARRRAGVPVPQGEHVGSTAEGEHMGSPLRNTMAFWFLGALAIGSLRPTNTWDFPLFLGLGVLAVVHAGWARRRELDLRNLIDIGLRVILLVGLAWVLFYPFSKWYAAGYNSAELWKGSKTTLESYLWVHGLFLFLLTTLLVRETRRWLAETPASAVADMQEWLGAVLFAAGAFVVMLGVLWYLGFHAALIAVPLLLWSAVLAIRPGQDDPRRAVFTLTSLGLLMTLVVEVVVLKGDISRMNTVFKFYLQVWTLFSVSAAVALAWLWAEIPGWRGRWPAAWKAALVVLFSMAALYTLLATSAKVRDRFAQNAPRSLDGAAYMQYAVHYDQDQAIPLGPDLAAIEWLQENVAGSPVIVEANTPEYRWGSRYTIYTGLPGVVGWNWHQRQQRAAVPSQVDAVWQRVNDINAFYMDTDLNLALEFLEKYQVEYIVVGDYEKAYYPPEGLQKFDRMVDQGHLTRAYSADGTTIYQRARDSEQ